MQPEDLSPADRELAQLAMIRVHHARKARARWAAAHQPAHKRYDVAGRLIAVNGVPCRPTITSWQQDKERKAG